MTALRNQAAQIARHGDADEIQVVDAPMPAPAVAKCGSGSWRQASSTPMS